jgi:hypothetical protein
MLVTGTNRSEWSGDTTTEATIGGHRSWGRTLNRFDAYGVVGSHRTNHTLHSPEIVSCECAEPSTPDYYGGSPGPHRGAAPHLQPRAASRQPWPEAAAHVSAQAFIGGAVSECTVCLTGKLTGRPPKLPWGAESPTRSSVLTPNRSAWMTSTRDARTAGSKETRIAAAARSAAAPANRSARSYSGGQLNPPRRIRPESPTSIN